MKEYCAWVREFDDVLRTYEEGDSKDIGKVEEAVNHLHAKFRTEWNGIQASVNQCPSRTKAEPAPCQFCAARLLAQAGSLFTHLIVAENHLDNTSACTESEAFHDQFHQKIHDLGVEFAACFDEHLMAYSKIAHP